MYREECDARKLLIANISSMSYGPDEEPEEEQEGSEKMCNNKIIISQLS